MDGRLICPNAAPRPAYAPRHCVRSDMASLMAAVDADILFFRVLELLFIAVLFICSSGIKELCG